MLNHTHITYPKWYSDIPPWIIALGQNLSSPYTRPCDLIITKFHWDFCGPWQLKCIVMNEAWENYDSNSAWCVYLVKSHSLNIRLLTTWGLISQISSTRVNPIDWWANIAEIKASERSRLTRHDAVVWLELLTLRLSQGTVSKTSVFPSAYKCIPRKKDLKVTFF